jgi:hypothetical protein
VQVVLGGDLFGLFEGRVTTGDHLCVVDVLVGLNVGVTAESAANHGDAIFCHKWFSLESEMVM